MGRPRSYERTDLIKFCDLIRDGHSVASAGELLGHKGKTLSLAIERELGVTIVGLRTDMLDAMEPFSEQKKTKASIRKHVRLPNGSGKGIGRPRVTHVRKCVLCGDSFETKKHNQRFCSCSCSAKAPKAAPTRSRPVFSKRCNRCKVEYETKREEQKYCSNQCRLARISSDKKRLVPIDCSECGLDFQPRDSSQRFCSRPCATLGRKRSGSVHGSYKGTSGKSIRFESSYELVFLLYADHHSGEYKSVRRFEEPIPYCWSSKNRNYYPDFLCEMVNGSKIITEIKSTSVYKRAASQTDAKLEAGRRWASEHGMEFLYLTDASLAFNTMCDWTSSNLGWAIVSHVKASKHLQTLRKQCLGCERDIPKQGKGVRAYLKRKFCSRDCMAQWRKRHRRDSLSPAQLTMCEICGNALYKKRHQRFCSKACYTASQQLLKEIACPICGTAFVPKSSLQKTCGKQCGIVNRVRSRVESGGFRDENQRNCMCSHCGCKFETNSRTRKYCGRKCYRAARKTHELSTCPTCGLDFYNYTGKLIFCSRKCVRKRK